eukprot:4325462-Prorocentrum_lima.AAC.1
MTSSLVGSEMCIRDSLTTSNQNGKSLFLVVDGDESTILLSTPTHFQCWCVWVDLVMRLPHLPS